MSLALHGDAEGGASTVLVTWQETSGGTYDAGTQAVVDGTEVLVSGTLSALVHTSEAKAVLRQYSEIQAGDVLLDLDSEPLVFYCAGQSLSGVTPLQSLAQKGVRFQLDDTFYTQAEVGEDLKLAFNARVKGQRLMSTIVLRVAT